MATRVFVIGRRNDLEGMDILVSDLMPSFQKTIYEGAPQPFYLQPGLDRWGATAVQLDAYVSGPRNTFMENADTPALDDTTGVGNDVLATQTACFGLSAYLQERVHAGGIGAANAPMLARVEANNAAQNILARVEAGADIELVDINFILAAIVAQTDLDGAGATSKSFGTVLDIMRIISGEVYRRPRFIITSNNLGQFRSLAERAVLVAAQIPGANGGSTFAANGDYLVSTEAGYDGRPTLARTGAFNISMGVGKLAMLKANVIGDSPWNAVETLHNPAFAYTAAAVTQTLPRAQSISGVALPADGTYGAVRVYLDTGEAL